MLTGRLFTKTYFAVFQVLIFGCKVSNSDAPNNNSPLRNDGDATELIEGFGTYFDGFGIPYGGCGVPQDFYSDDNGKAIPFIALNTQNTQLKAEGLSPPIIGEKQGLFADGKNCGRWIRFWPKENCKHGVQEAEDGKICIDPSALEGAKQAARDDGQFEDTAYLDYLQPSDYGVGRYVEDSETRTPGVDKPLYGIIADSCQDPNYWCRLDPGHIDIATFYLQDFIDRGLWNNRKVAWEFIDGVPEEFQMGDLKFAWGEKAELGKYLPLIVYHTPRGIGKVVIEDKVLPMNGRLGQQFSLPYELTNQTQFEVEVYDVDDALYGKYKLEFPEELCQGGCQKVEKVSAENISR